MNVILNDRRVVLLLWEPLSFFDLLNCSRVNKRWNYIFHYEIRSLDLSNDHLFEHKKLSNKIGFYGNIGAKTLSWIPKTFPNLQSLNLNGQGYVWNSPATDGRICFVDGVKPLLEHPNLTCLSIDGEGAMPSATITGLEKMTQLQELVLGTTNHAEMDYSFFLHGMTNLEKVTLKGGVRKLNPRMPLNFSRYPKLVELELCDTGYTKPPLPPNLRILKLCHQKMEGLTAENLVNVKVLHITSHSAEFDIPVESNKLDHLSLTYEVFPASVLGKVSKLRLKSLHLDGGYKDCLPFFSKELKGSLKHVSLKITLESFCTLLAQLENVPVHEICFTTTKMTEDFKEELFLRLPIKKISFDKFDVSLDFLRVVAKIKDLEKLENVKVCVENGKDFLEFIESNFHDCVSLCRFTIVPYFEAWAELAEIFDAWPSESKLESFLKNFKVSQCSKWMIFLRHIKS